METINLADFSKAALNSVVKNSPKLLTATGIGGFVITVIWAVKAKDKATLLLDEAREIKRAETNNPEAELTRWETVKAVTPAYWPAALVFVISAGAIIGSDYISEKRQAVLSVACAAADSALKEFESKTVEKIGENKTDQIKQEIAQENINKNPLSKDSDIYSIQDERYTTFYEPYCGQYFKAEIEDVKAVTNIINYKLNCGENVTLNDVYYELSNISVAGNITETTLGSSKGWSFSDGLVNHKLLAITDPRTDKPIFSLQYDPRPCELY